ncbi:MAG TPA: class I SAM-dependent methyltransferase [Planktothrix sp.]|jgi:ubiquinone/menaquinone biosynthesis C-methylase UbiE
MHWKTVAEYWDKNAEAWTELTRAGSDICRDNINTPCFLSMLPEVKGLRGLDIGCGEGHNTRLVAQRGAMMIAIDVSETFVSHAQATETEKPLNIEYGIASATELPYPDQTFDFVMSTMALMDIAESDQALAEAFRVLKRGGFFQFSICHPCFQTPRWEWVERDGEIIGIICGDYFKKHNGFVEEWTFSGAPAELVGKHANFQVPRFDRTLSEWINSLTSIGFKIDQIEEPIPTEEAAEKHPTLKKYRNIPFFMHFRCSK